MALLIQFLLRLSFGLAVGMFFTTSERVTSGFYRNHLYVTLGLTTLAALLSFSLTPEVFWCAVAAAAFSYVGSVCWLYEKPKLGSAALAAIFFIAGGGATFQNVAMMEAKYENGSVAKYFPEDLGIAISQAGRDKQLEIAGSRLYSSSLSVYFTPFTSGLLLGMTMAAMLLGHWYLNSPTMELAPLRLLILLIGVAVVSQGVMSLLGLWGEITYGGSLGTQWILFVVLRWTFGLLGVGALAWMAWQTLNIPNTQSATGILYVAVIGTFVGETMALLLSAESLFPL